MEQIKRDRDSFGEIISEVYLLVLFLVYPYYYTEGYAHIGQDKYQFFRNVTWVFLSTVAVICLAGALSRNRRQVRQERRVFYLSLPDLCVLAFGFCAAVSFFLCGDKKTGFWGANGWHMGLFMQLTFVCLYFAVSRCWKWEDYLFPFVCIGSGGVFALGILHRFGIDPLGLYVGEWRGKTLLFLSTIGQATWYSSFVCTLFPVGVFLFLRDRSEKMRIFSAVYLALAFGTIVTQNSDSAFAALGAVLLVVFWDAFESREKWKRFMELLLLLCTALWQWVCCKCCSLTGRSVLERFRHFSHRACG